MTTALLLLDLQNFFGTMLPYQKPCVNNIHQLIDHFRARGLPIILTQHGHEEEAFRKTAGERPPHTNQLIRKWGTAGLAVRDSKDWELIPSIAETVEEMQQGSSSGIEGEEIQQDSEPVANIWRPGKGEQGSTLVIAQKETYDAFIGTSLLKSFEDPEMQKVERIIVGGVMTDCCVETSARSCFNRGWETIIVSDAAASAGHEQHRRALVGFEFAFGEVLETEEVLQRVK